VISGFQIRAGRALLQWTRRRLAKESGLYHTTIEQIEGRADTSVCRVGSLDAIEDAFRRYGVRLVEGGAIRDQRPVEATSSSVATLSRSIDREPHQGGGVGPVRFPW
jgi:hypothetical protein